jgi:hypothetical protein
MNIVAKSILIILFIPLFVFLFFLVVLMAIGWIFGAKIKITDSKTKLKDFKGVKTRPSCLDVEQRSVTDQDAYTDA